MKMKKKQLITLLITLVLLFVVIIPKLSNNSNKPIKVIFDCDMGYMNDDTLALSM